MAFRMFNLVFTYVLCVPFMILVSPDELSDISIREYIKYINPPAVHKYKVSQSFFYFYYFFPFKLGYKIIYSHMQHDNGDSILCVKFTDQISLQPAIQQYGYDQVRYYILCRKEFLSDYDEDWRI